MRSLYEISTDLIALKEYLIESGGEVTDKEAEAQIDALLMNLGNERDAKIDGMCCLIRDFETSAGVRNSEALRLKELADMDLIIAGRIRNRVKEFFERHEMSKLNTERFQLSLNQNGSVLPLAYPEEWKSNPVLAPEKYKKFVVELNKFALRSDLESGVTVAGCSLGERQNHLRVR